MSDISQRCRNFSLQNGTGICKKLDCICRCYSCKHAEECDWIEKCSTVNWKPVPNSRDLLLTASRKLRDTIRNIMRDIPLNELVGGLLCRREEAILRAFTFYPGDITEAFLVQEYLKEAPNLRASDLKQTERFVEFFNLVVFRDTFDRDRNKIERGDLKFFATSEGLKQLQKMADSPVEYMNDTYLEMEKMFEEKKKPSFELHNNVLHVWTKKMIEPLRWSMHNQVPLEIVRADHTDAVNGIMAHMEELGKAVEKHDPIFLDKGVCFDLSYGLYNSLIAIVRCLYNNCKELQKATAFLVKNSVPLSFAFKHEVNIQNWDTFVIDAYLREKSGRYLFDYRIPAINDWQISIREGTFWGSVLLLTFIQKNYDEIVLNRYSKGWIFEEILRTELIDRSVNIPHKNFPTPYGDIDYICEKDGKAYAIEAKDYGPWYGEWYINSKKFESRKKILGRRINTFMKRLNWLNSHLENARIERSPIPISISSYKEDYIEINLPIPELDKVFGPSKYPSFKESLPRFELKKDEFRVKVSGREVYKSV